MELLFRFQVENWIILSFRIRKLISRLKRISYTVHIANAIHTIYRSGDYVLSEREMRLVFFRCSFLFFVFVLFGKWIISRNEEFTALNMVKIEHWKYSYDWNKQFHLQHLQTLAFGVFRSFIVFFLLCHFTLECMPCHLSLIFHFGLPGIEKYFFFFFLLFLHIATPVAQAYHRKHIRNIDFGFQLLV